MFVFKRKQTIVEIGGVKLGGQPGECLTVLGGGVFFKGQPIVKNTKRGTFNEEKLRLWIRRMEEMMTITGNSGLIQVYGGTPKAIVKHISWIADNWSGPFTFESIDPITRIRAMEYVDEAGLQKRAIFNSVNISTSYEELTNIRHCRIMAAIALGWSPLSRSLDARMKVLEDQIARCENIGVKKIIVDPASLPIEEGYGLEWRTNLAIKAIIGLPICNGSFNAPSSWSLYRENRGDEATRVSILSAAAVAARLTCADLLFYGSLERAKEMFSAIALVEKGIFRAASEAQSAIRDKRGQFNIRS